MFNRVFSLPSRQNILLVCSVILAVDFATTGTAIDWNGAGSDTSGVQAYVGRRIDIEGVNYSSVRLSSNRSVQNRGEFNLNGLSEDFTRSFTLDNSGLSSYSGGSMLSKSIASSRIWTSTLSIMGFEDGLNALRFDSDVAGLTTQIDSTGFATLNLYGAQLFLS